MTVVLLDQVQRVATTRLMPTSDQSSPDSNPCGAPVRCMMALEKRRRTDDRPLGVPPSYV